eukprot:TRINITY_DN12529_c0_g1_i2.p2 TRINITY_DN12529_c0_g1~~TRINITY_DN12529_c0_g1_i2.p2  ORF type:complete len:118 (+),score=11.85 TRINITY_DN12529_c0_g1_i2:109-462(+)
MCIRDRFNFVQKIVKFSQSSEFYLFQIIPSFDGYPNGKSHIKQFSPKTQQQLFFHPQSQFDSKLNSLSIQFLFIQIIKNWEQQNLVKPIPFVVIMNNKKNENPVKKLPQQSELFHSS